MREAYPPPRPESKEALPTPDVGQMVHDLMDFDPTGTKAADVVDSVGFMKINRYSFPDDQPWDLFQDGHLFNEWHGYGYRNPIFTANEQAEAARARGEEPPLTPERVACDIYYYEVERRKADVSMAFPPFEELFGYPDPRPTHPAPDSWPEYGTSEDDHLTFWTQ